MRKKQVTKKSAIKGKQSYRPTILVCAGLVLLGLIVYGQLYNADFVHFDDEDYVVENTHIQHGFTAESIKWAFTTGHASNWHPVTWLSLMADYNLFAGKAGGYHVINVLLHIINSVLVFLLLKKMTGGFWQSAFIAALFAIHPSHVESVAWVSERKDVLSSMFWLLTMWAYLLYVQNKSVKWYAVMIVIYVVGLLTKPMLVTLPFVLLLMDYWPLQRIEKFSLSGLRRLVLEKLPMLLLAAGSSVVTYIVQQKGGAMVDTTYIATSMRIGNTFISYMKYILMLFWPLNFGVFYPYSWNDTSPIYARGSAVLLIAITVLVIVFARRYKYLPVGWFWYLGTLVPVIGLVQVGMQSMADRYTYLPFIGLFIIIAWGVGDILAKRQNKKQVVTIAAGGVIAILTVCGFVQASYWHDSVTLFEHTLKVTEGPTENNGRIHNNLCVVYNRRDDFAKAIEHGLKAVEYDGDSANSHYNLGIAYYRTGQFEKAVDCWEQAVRLDPKNNEAHNNLGALYYQNGQVDLAIKHFKCSLTSNPKDAYAAENLAIAEKAIAPKQK